MTRRRLVALAVLVAAFAVALALRVPGPAREAAPEASSLGDFVAALPEPVEPAFGVATPRPLSDDVARYHWAPVLREVEARRAPLDNAPGVAHLDTQTPEWTSNIVVVIGRREIRGRVWARVLLPVLGSDRSGWLPRTALGGYAEVRAHLVVDLDAFDASLFVGDRVVFRSDVGVGTAESPTPRGTFYVRNKLTRFRNPFYGPIAFGTSARSPVLTDWPGGGFVGIHGTNRPELLPGRVSHGCIRLRNRDILRLARLMPVGTLVTFR